MKKRYFRLKRKVLKMDAYKFYKFVQDGKYSFDQLKKRFPDFEREINYIKESFLNKVCDIYTDLLALELIKKIFDHVADVVRDYMNGKINDDEYNQKI